MAINKKKGMKKKYEWVVQAKVALMKMGRVGWRKTVDALEKGWRKVGWRN